MGAVVENVSCISGRGLVDAVAFKNGMRRLAGAVCILTLRKDGARAGLTATAVMSVSAEPPRLMVCVNRSVFAHELLDLGGVLCVNVLGTSNLDDARRFAGMVEGVSGDARFMGGAWFDVEDGAPALADALATFQCRVIELMPAGSHTLVLCEVVAVGLPVNRAEPLPAEQPLVYFDGRFVSLGELQ